MVGNSMHIIFLCVEVCGAEMSCDYVVEIPLEQATFL